MFINNSLINRTTLFPLKSLKKQFINSINIKELLFESNNDYSINNNASVNLSIASKKYLTHHQIKSDRRNWFQAKRLRQSSQAFCPTIVEIAVFSAFYRGARTAPPLLS